MSLILNDKALKSVCESINSQDEAIVLTHGAYDLLHIGHIEFLKRSKAMGKYLFVGVDSDERVYRYKKISITRPIIPVKYRMEMLINLKFVDAVFCIDGKDLGDRFFYKLYRTVQPSVVTYGKTHSFSENVTERIETLKKADPFFRKAQAKIIRHQYEDIISTTSIMNSILEKADASLPN
jgi:cytidyltransferase-like protein